MPAFTYVDVYVGIVDGDDIVDRLLEIEMFDSVGANIAVLGESRCNIRKCSL